MTMIDSILAHTKFNRRCDRFKRSGRSACPWSSPGFVDT